MQQVSNKKADSESNWTVRYREWFAGDTVCYESVESYNISTDFYVQNRAAIGKEFEKRQEKRLQ